MALCREWAERIKNDLGEISKETVSFSSGKKKKKIHAWSRLVELEIKKIRDGEKVIFKNHHILLLI